MNVEALRKNFECRKREARKRKIAWSLTFEQFCELMRAPKCCITGKSLYPEHRSEELRLSFDRVDNSVGYTHENIRLVSSRLNRIKSDASEYELQMIVDYVRKTKGE